MRAAVIIALMLGVTGCTRNSNPKAGEFLERGKQFMKAKDYPRAILEFKNEAKLAPGAAEPHYQLALAYLAAENFGDAIAQLRQATTLDPKHVDAQLKLAEIFAASRDKSALLNAEKRVKDVLVATPVSPPGALRTLALAEFGLGKLEDASAQLDAQMKKVPDDLKSAELLATIQSSKKDVPGAEATLRNVAKAAPESADAAVALGRFYQQVRRDDRQAEGEFRRALKLDSKHSLALANLALLQRRGGRLSEAEATFKQLSENPDREYRFLYGQFLIGEGRKDAALAEFERLARRDPKDRTARTILVSTYVFLNRPEDAERVISNALQDNPKDLEALLQRGEILLRKGRLNEAQADLNQVLHAKPDSAEAHFILSRLRRAQGASSSQRQELAEVLRLNPGLLAARIELAREQIADHKPAEALHTLDQVPARHKSDVAFIQQRNWTLLALGNKPELKRGITQGLAIARSRDLLLQDALLEASNGNYQAARSRVEEVLKQDPYDIGALEDLMLTYVAQQQVPAGLERLGKIVVQRPTSATLQMLLGRWLETSGKRNEARAAYEAAKRADPGVKAADFSIGKLDFGEGAYDAAVKRFTDLKASPEFGVQSLLWLGQIEEKRGNNIGALNFYREAVQRDQRNATALNNLAYLLADFGGRPDEALQYAQQAKELLPNSISIDDTIGWAYYKKAIYRTAVEYLEKAAVSNSPARVKYHLAMAYAKIGDSKRGRLALNAALKQDPNLPEARIALEMLRAM